MCLPHSIPCSHISNLRSYPLALYPPPLPPKHAPSHALLFLGYDQVAGMVVVWNILLAPCTLGEDMTTKRISSAVVIMLGIVGAGSFGPHFEAERTPDQELQQLFTTGGAIFYYLLLFSFLAIGYGVVLPNEEWMPKQSLRNGALQGGCATTRPLP